MGLLIKVKDARFTKYIGVAEIVDDPTVPDVPDDPTVPDDYPVTDTLKALYYLGVNETDSITDRSHNDNDATDVLGNVTFNDGYVSITDNEGANYIKTPVTTSVENKTTIVALFRVPSGKRVIVGNYKSNNNYGFALTNDRVYVTSSVSGAGKTFETAINSNNFAIVAITVDANSYRVVRDNDGTINELLSYTDGGIYQWTQPFAIGGQYGNMSLNNDADIALVSIHEGDLTDAQLQHIFEHVRWYGESKGLTIE